MVLLEAGSRLGHHGARQGRWRCPAQPEEVWEGLEKAPERVEKRRVPLDILMHIATAQALLAGMKCQYTFYKEAAKRYLIAVDKYQSSDEDERHATKTGTDPKVSSAVRGLCIGMRFPQPEHVMDLIHASVECGRMTHTYPTGFLGCLCMALFSSYAVQGKPVSQWGRLMLGALPIAEQYCRRKIDFFTDYSENWFYFETKWQLYLQQRKIDREGCDDPFFPENYDSSERNKLYRHWCIASPGKRKGVELTLMVYDALLGAAGDWTELCQWAMCHGGDSEQTGCMAGCLYGLLYGSLGVPSTFLLNLGLKDLMERLAEALYSAANRERPQLGDDPVSSTNDPVSSGEFSASLWQAVKRLSCKRANDEINTLLNYTALLEQGVASWQDSGRQRRKMRRGRCKGTDPPSQPRPSRFQLLRSRFTKLGLRDNLHRLRPPPLERPITTKLCLLQAKDPSQREKESQPKFPSQIEKKSQAKDPSQREKESQPKDCSQREKESQPKDPSQIEKESQPKDLSQIEKESQPKDCSQREKESQPKDLSQIEKESQPKDCSQREKESQPKDLSQIEKESQPKDLSQIEKESQSKDRSQREKESQSKDPSQIEKESQPKDRSQREKESQPKVPSQIEKKSQPKDLSQIEKESQSKDRSQREKESQSKDPSQIEKESQPKDRSQREKESQPKDLSQREKESLSKDHLKIEKESQPKYPSQREKESQPKYHSESERESQPKDPSQGQKESQPKDPSQGQKESQPKDPSQGQKVSQPHPVMKTGHALYTDSASSTLVGRQTEGCSMMGSRESGAVIGHHGGVDTKGWCVRGELPGSVAAELANCGPEDENGDLITPGGGPATTDSGTLCSPVERCISPSRGVEFEVRPYTQARGPGAGDLGYDPSLSGHLWGKRAQPDGHGSGSKACAEPESAPGHVLQAKGEGTLSCCSPAEEQHRKRSEVSLTTPIRVRTGLESPPEKTGLESPPEPTGLESPPGTTGLESPPEPTGLESPAEPTGLASPAETTGLESPPEMTGLASPAEPTGLASPAETTGLESPPETTGLESPPETTGLESPPETTGLESPPETTGLESPPETTGLESPPETTGLESPPETTGLESPPETTGLESPPEMTGLVSSSERTGPKSPSERTALESLPKSKAQHWPAVLPPPTCADLPHGPKPFPWKYRTHCYAEDLCTTPSPKIILSIGMRSGRLVKMS